MTRVAFVCIFLVALTESWGRVAQNAGSKTEGDDARTTIAGVWRGHSVCVDKNRPCHHEVNVYRFPGVAGRLNEFSVTASKVGEGKEIVMGNGEWKYDEKKKLVESETPPMRLGVNGKKMEGVLRLADGTVYRRIYWEKEN
jgi:hypothetical protein